jgi:hypothetical protein
VVVLLVGLTEEEGKSVGMESPHGSEPNGTAGDRQNVHEHVRVTGFLLLDTKHKKIDKARPRHGPGGPSAHGVRGGQEARLRVNSVVPDYLVVERQRS